MTTASDQYVLVTITDSLSPANMPYNEFVLYRLRHEPDVKQFFIVLFASEVSPGVSVPRELTVYFCGKKISMLRRALAEIDRISRNERRNTVFHIHEAKSVLLFCAAAMGKRHNIVYTLHSTFSNYKIHNKIFSVIASVLSGKVVCVGEASYRHYPGLLKKILGRRVIFIQNGVDCERIDRVPDGQKANGCSNAGTLRLIYVARLVSLKRHDILLRAVKELPQAALTLIGRGPLKESLRALAQAYGICDRVSFLGMLPRDEVFAQIKAHDVYISSSSYEGLPISLLEAMSCGVVCAASDIEQHREIKEKCPSLILVNNTPEDWTRVLRAVADMPPEERERIVRQNKKDVDEGFSLERMHRQYDAVYQEIAEAKHGK